MEDTAEVLVFAEIWFAVSRALRSSDVYDAPGDSSRCGKGSEAAPCLLALCPLVLLCHNHRDVRRSAREPCTPSPLPNILG